MGDTSERSKGMALLRDCCAITGAGLLIGLAANAVSPRGVSLTRDYFQSGTTAAQHAVTSSAAAPVTPPNVASTAKTKRGLALATHEEVEALFHDPRYREQKILFIDARDDARYQAGHIPGAYPFDHYRPEQHVAAVLGVAQLADQIVVYCTGGDCEDSELAVLDLMSFGIPPSKLVIYGGGITEWSRRRLPVEAGVGPASR